MEDKRKLKDIEKHGQKRAVKSHTNSARKIVLLGGGAWGLLSKEEPRRKEAGAG